MPTTVRPLILTREAALTAVDRHMDTPAMVGAVPDDDSGGEPSPNVQYWLWSAMALAKARAATEKGLDPRQAVLDLAALAAKWMIDIDTRKA